MFTIQRFVFLVACLLCSSFLIGCGNSDPVLGNWEIDTKAMESQFEELNKDSEAGASSDSPDDFDDLMGNMGDAMGDMLEKQMQEAILQMQIDLVVNADGTFVVTTGWDDNHEVTNGSWTRSGSSYAFNSDEGDSATATLDGDTLVLDSDDEPFNLHLKRK